MIARGVVEMDGQGKPIRMPGVVVDITDRVMAEAERGQLSSELERQGRVTETLLSSIADFAYIFDRAGRFVYANQPLLDLWGLKLADALGKDFFELHYPDELAAKLQRQIQDVFETGQKVSDKTSYIGRNGEAGYYEYIFSPVPGADGQVELVAGSTREITERQNTLEILQRSEENFRTLTETLPDSVWAAAPDGSIQWTNSVLPRATGVSLEQLLDLGIGALVHPDDLVETREVWEQAKKTGQPFEFQHRIKQADGSWRWHLVRGTPARNDDGSIYRWIGTSTDVHEQRELQSKLERSEALFRQLADTIPQLAWMARPDGWIFWYNQRWFEYTGTTQEDMEGWGWKQVHDPNELLKVLPKWQACIENGEPFDMTFPIKGADGTFRPFLTRVMPFRDETGKIALWFGTNTDVSEQKRIIQERDELLASERAARSSAEHASRMKDEFLATLSHELRTP